MELRTEAPEVVGSLATLSDFYDENSAAARRRLRSTIENRGVAVNEEFLTAAQSVIQVGAGCCNLATPHPCQLGVQRQSVASVA